MIRRDVTLTEQNGSSNPEMVRRCSTVQYISRGSSSIVPYSNSSVRRDLYLIGCVRCVHRETRHYLTILYYSVLGLARTLPFTLGADTNTPHTHTHTHTQSCFIQFNSVFSVKSNPHLWPLSVKGLSEHTYLAQIPDTFVYWCKL